MVIKGERWVIAGVLAVVTIVGSIGVLTTAHRSAGTAADAIATSADVPADSTAAKATPTVPVSGEALVAAVAAGQSSSSSSTHKPGKVGVAATVKTTAKAKATTAPKAGTSSSSSSSGKVQGTGRIKFGVTYKGDGTFYGATGGGSCMFDTTTNLMVAAMNETDYDNSNACGDYLRVKGPNGNSINIRIVDSCPECAPGALDLSAQAFAKLAAPSAGRIKISWHLRSPALTGPVSYQYKSGSSQWWCGIQVRNHRNPVRSLELKVNGKWKNIPRASYNYFISADGSGCGSSIRITDIYGHRLTDSGIKITPDVVQKGHAQFAGVS